MSLLWAPFLSPTDEEKAKKDPAYHLKTTNLETRETLAELYRDYKGDELLASTMKEPKAKKTDKLNAVSVLRYCFSSCSQWQRLLSLLSSLINFFLFCLSSFWSGYISWETQTVILFLNWLCFTIYIWNWMSNGDFTQYQNDLSGKV